MGIDTFFEGVFENEKEFRLFSGYAELERNEEWGLILNNFLRCKRAQSMRYGLLSKTSGKFEI